MQTTKDEAKFMPLFLEKGKAKQLQFIRLSYLMLTNLSKAHSQRITFFRNEHKGYKNALSFAHNQCRFKNKKVLLPLREKEQLFFEALRKKEKAEKEAKKEAIKGLKYGRKFKTLNIGTLERCHKAGIIIRLDNRIIPYAELKRQLDNFF